MVPVGLDFSVAKCKTMAAMQIFKMSCKIVTINFIEVELMLKK